MVHSLTLHSVLYIPVTTGSHKAPYCGGYIRPQQAVVSKERRAHVHVCQTLLTL